MSVHVTHDGPVCIVTIDRPEVRNAVDGPTAQLLADAFRAFDADPTLAVAVLTAVARPTGWRDVTAPCGCEVRLTRSWVGELPRTLRMCETRAAGKSCAAVRGGM